MARTIKELGHPCYITYSPGKERKKKKTLVLSLVLHISWLLVNVSKYRHLALIILTWIVRTLICDIVLSRQIWYLAQVLICTKIWSLLGKMHSFNKFLSLSADSSLSESWSLHHVLFYFASWNIHFYSSSFLLESESSSNNFIIISSSLL